MNLRQVVMTGVAGVLLTGLSMTVSQAQTGAFANFTSNGSTVPGKFTFTNGGTHAGANSTFVSGPGTTQAATAITFKFMENVGAYTNGQAIAATLLFSAQVPAGVAGKAQGGGGFFGEKFTGISLVIKDSLNRNLLTISQKAPGTSTGLLSGSAKTATLQGSSSDGFQYTSDFLAFAPGSSNGYSLTLTLLSALGINANGYLKSFNTGSSAGQFSASGFSPIPEASTLLGFGGMLTGGGLLCLRRRKVCSRA